jgi:hypothetical protein
MALSMASVPSPAALAGRRGGFTLGRRVARTSASSPPVASSSNSSSSSSFLSRSPGSNGRGRTLALLTRAASNFNVRRHVKHSTAAAAAAAAAEAERKKRTYYEKAIRLSCVAAEAEDEEKAEDEEEADDEECAEAGAALGTAAKARMNGVNGLASG